MRSGRYGPSRRRSGRLPSLGYNRLQEERRPLQSMPRIGSPMSSPPPSSWLQRVTLTSGRVTLEPLAHGHAAELAEAVKDGELWRLWYTAIPTPEGIAAEIDRRLRLQAAG